MHTFLFPQKNVSKKWQLVLCWNFAVACFLTLVLRTDRSSFRCNICNFRILCREWSQMIRFESLLDRNTYKFKIFRVGSDLECSGKVQNVKKFKKNYPIFPWLEISSDFDFTFVLRITISSFLQNFILHICMTWSQRLLHSCALGDHIFLYTVMRSPRGRNWEMSELPLLTSGKFFHYSHKHASRLLTYSSVQVNVFRVFT